MMKSRAHYTGGLAMLTAVVVFLFISMTIVFGIVRPVLRGVAIAEESMHSKKSYYAAEAAIEDIFTRLQKNTTIGTTETLAINGGTVTVTTVNSVGGKDIVAESIVNGTYRKLKAQVARGDGVVFKYGTQSGQGGFVLENNSVINGSLYSNGNIYGSNGAYITGDAIVAGPTGLIDNLDIGVGGTGNGYAHSIRNLNATGILYCQSGSGNNKACNTSQADPVPLDLPLKDAEINSWKDDAALGGTITGNTTISTPTTMGPKKIVGNLTISSTLTLANTIYVTGNINISGTVKLASSFGATSGIIIADGYITIGNSTVFQDSGTPGSYIMLLSTSNCDVSMAASPCFGNEAISVGNNSNITIVNAQKGTVYFSNNASVREAVGNKIRLKNNSTISYGTGIINATFTSGPAGGYNMTSLSETQ